jgi:arsenite methyltransferase
MDISAEMLRIADQKREAQGVTNVTFRQGTLDGGHPYQPESFDSVWAYSVLHLVPDRRRVLATLFDLLKPGGSLIASSVCLGDAWVPYGPIIAVMRWFGKAPVVHVYSRETMLRELREIGFVDVTVRDVGAERMVAFVVAKKPTRSS